MGVLSNGCKLGTFSNGFEPAILCAESNGCPRGSVEGEGEEAVAGSGFSSASSTDLEELLEDGADMVEAVQVLLQGLGEDVHRVGLIKTPLRVARSLAFATKGYRQVAKDVIGDALFPEAGVEAGFGFAGGFGGMVVVRSIDLFSLCEACLLPFKVCCHIAYISSGLQVVGLSKLPRVADMFARRLQNPQTLAEQICQGLADTIKPLGVAVVLQSLHLPVPGVHHDVNTSKNLFLHPTLSFAGKGQFEDKSSDAWLEFLAMLQLEGIVVDREDAAECNGSGKKMWCPCLPLDMDTIDTNHAIFGPAYSNGSSRRVNSENGIHYSSSLSSAPEKSGEKVSAMVAAVEAILESLVEGTTKEELRLTACCFTRWLLNFKRAHQESELAVKDNSVKRTLTSMNGHGSIRVSSKVEFSVNMTRDAVNSSAFLAELDAPFCSLCEHHLLPFFGKAHVGYFATEVTLEVIDRSAVLEIVEILSHKLQVQERLTKEIAEALTHRFNLQSIIVVLEASHICMVSRGVEKLGSSTVTVAVFGHFATDVSAKAAFLKKISNSRSVKRTCN